MPGCCGSTANDVRPITAVVQVESGVVSARAISVVQYLISLGVPSQRLSRPVLPNSSRRDAATEEAQATAH